MIAHSKLTKCQMLSWIKDRIDGGAPMPTDEEIADRFDLSGVESARTLLSDLADEGAITIGWNKPGRPIALGPRERRVTVSPTPIPSVVKHDDALDAGVAKIIGVVGRSPGVVAPKPAASADPKRDHAIGMERLPTAPGRKLDAPPRAVPISGARQINARVDGATYASIGELAGMAGVSVSAMCATLVREALTARQSATAAPAKPRIPAAVMAAYLADGREFGAFIGELLDLGLIEYRARLDEGVAA